MKKIDTSKVMLNDLLKINAERVERYKRASYDIFDQELKSVFYTIADDSRKNLTEINTFINNQFGELVPDKTVKTGKIYRSWIDVKSRFNGTARNNLLNSCEFGELAVVSAYGMAKTETNNPAIIELLSRQEESLKSSLDVIKSYRLAYDKINKVPR